MSKSSQAEEPGKPAFDSVAAHTQFSASCFNEAWTYMERASLNPDEAEAMLHASHASYYHWSHRADFSPQSQSIGLWQLSRVYLLASHSYLAAHFARQCIKISEHAELDPFYVAYAYEAMARAQTAIGLGSEAERSLAYARDLAEKVKDKKERKAINNDLDLVEQTITKHP